MRAEKTDRLLTLIHQRDNLNNTNENVGNRLNDHVRVLLLSKLFFILRID